jgi:hypothetical protein
VNERGWGWTAAELRHAWLIEWIVQQCGERPEGQGIPVEPYYRALPNQNMNMNEVARGDLDALERESLIRKISGMGGIEALDVQVTSEGRAFVERLQVARGNKQRRRSACRDAIIEWLYSRDAVSPPGLIVNTMLDDPLTGAWFAQRFPIEDVLAASGWLCRQGLVKGTILWGPELVQRMSELAPDSADFLARVARYEAPSPLYLTDTGEKCAEDFGSDTRAYLERQQYRPHGPSVSIGTHSGPLQVAGDSAQQVQNVGASPSDLREMITGITEIVRALVPDTRDADLEEQLALAAISDQGADKSALQRFHDWTVSTVRAGATSAAVAVVSSATTTLLIEAGHLASHLG